MLISETLAQFAVALQPDDIPAAVRERAKLLMLDAVGIALASSRQDFARSVVAGLGAFGAGPGFVIGHPTRLAVRDAIVANGVLVHGLDYDDTHSAGVIHTSASCLPAALGVGAHARASGHDVLTAFVLGTEVAARLGMVARGTLQEAGFHPAGMLAPFAAALIAGKLQGLSADQLVMAQGIALSTGSSCSRQFNREGSATKKLHPGWGAAAGVTAAALAEQGFTGPRAAYEGDYGLYPLHLGARFERCDLGLATWMLGTCWETSNIALKPMPACLHLHAVIDAAAEIRAQHGIEPSRVESVRVLLPREAVDIVCEPAAARRRPASAYAAQHSLPFAMACALVRGRFSLQELEPGTLQDPGILGLADRVHYDIDPASGFPKVFSGEVIVRLKDGPELRHREAVNRGNAERPLTAADITRKFHDNAQLVLPAAQAAAIEQAVLEIDRQPDLTSLEGLLAADA